MGVAENKVAQPWLLLVFTLPASRATERVNLWRKLQRYGALMLPSSGYVLPGSPVNQERFEWLARSIRSLKGHASVAQVSAFDDLHAGELEDRFSKARTGDYEHLYAELKALIRSRKGQNAIPRFKRRLQRIVEIDFFGASARARVEELISRIETGRTVTALKTAHDSKNYLGRTWITRPRPGIDRVSCAWLISRFIDRDARFIFDKEASRHPKAIPFDMFQPGGFGHVGDDCTFETLMKSFGLKDARLKLLAQAVHDADLADERFGRDEALGIDRVLDGWNEEGVSDDDILRRGMEMIEGLYRGIR